MPKRLSDKLKELPNKPGVYIFKDFKGLILYVGKAINLKNRVRSYFSEGRPRSEGTLRIERMISQISDLDYTVTDNEVESLILENNFIKQLKPKYNVLLRDDKNYLFIKINLHDQIPTINYERELDDRTARYFGPYTSGMAIKDTLRLVRKIFPYCANSKMGSNPCFYYHIGKCPGVCAGKITMQNYRNNYIKKIIKFLQGRQLEILDDLKTVMREASKNEQYEKAAKLRDQIFALNRILERQKIIYPKKVDQDIFSLHREGTIACANLFLIREGKLVQKENFILENVKQIKPAEVMESFLSRYYLEASSIPKEIVLPFKINKQELRASLRAKRSNLKSEIASSQAPRNDRIKNIKITIPHHGKKLELLKLGQKNAQVFLEANSDKKILEESRLLNALKELQKFLSLPNLPGRIEAFDISNIQGKNAVGSMVVFDFARPKKEDYRKFKIKSKNTPDDFAMMREMLERRFKRSIIRNNNPLQITDHGSRVKAWPLPDLILIDGGKGQVNAALAALRISNFEFLQPSLIQPTYPKLLWRSWQLRRIRQSLARRRIISKKIPIIGLAKRLEEIFLPENPNPLILPPNSPALFLLQRIRDEAHRFAVTYHRKLRSKNSLHSILDEIEGIGPVKKKALLSHFGSLSKIRAAGVTELANLIGHTQAEKLKAKL